MLSCSIWLSAPSFWMGGGPEGRSVWMVLHPHHTHGPRKTGSAYPHSLCAEEVAATARRRKWRNFVLTKTKEFENNLLFRFFLFRSFLTNEIQNTRCAFIEFRRYYLLVILQFLGDFDQTTWTPLSKGDKQQRNADDQIFELGSFAQSDNNDAHSDVAIFADFLIVHLATFDGRNAAKFTGVRKHTPLVVSSIAFKKLHTYINLHMEIKHLNMFIRYFERY